jgi:hypothetical protein
MLHCYNHVNRNETHLSSGSLCGSLSHQKCARRYTFATTLHSKIAIQLRVNTLDNSAAGRGYGHGHRRERWIIHFFGRYADFCARNHWHDGALLSVSG